jgi:MraZ protein
MPERTGKTTVSFDANGRLKLPNKLIEALPEEQRSKIVVTRGIEHCVSLYSLSDWEQYKNSIDMIQGLSVIDRQNLRRKFIGNATDVAVDKQGRITLPEELIKYAQLQGCEEVTVIGIEQVIEIWNPTVFEENDEQSEAKALDALNRRPAF